MFEDDNLLRDGSARTSMPSSSRQKRNREQTLSGAFSLFRDYIKDKSTNLTEGEFESFRLQFLLVYLMAMHLAKYNGVTTADRQKILHDLYNALYFPENMATSAKYELDRDSLELLTLMPLNWVLMLFHPDFFPDDTVRFSDHFQIIFSYNLCNYFSYDLV
jgi:hypothetical protein